MVYQVTLENDKWPYDVYVEADSIESAKEKALVEYPGHKVIGINEKANVAMLIK